MLGSFSEGHGFCLVATIFFIEILGARARDVQLEIRLAIDNLDSVGYLLGQFRGSDHLVILFIIGLHVSLNVNISKF